MEKVKELVTGKSKAERHAERATGASDVGASYRNVGGTVGAEGTPGIAGPVAPAATGAGAGVGEAGAYGTSGYGATTTGAATEGVTETRAGTVEVPVVQQTTTGAAPVRAEGGAAETCAQEYFTKVEDRPVVKERVELIQESRPVEKEFVVETRQTGAEKELGRTEVEHLGTTERVVSEATPKAPCE